MKIVIPGGSGLLGKMLSAKFHGCGHEVIVICRQPMNAPWKVVGWDGKNSGPWELELENADAVINLSGRSVNCRYNAKNRLEIMQSRVDSTRAVGRAIADRDHPPKMWLQASTATIYSHRFDAANDEIDGILSGNQQVPETWQFSDQVAKAWEACVDETPLAKTKKALLRISIVMSAEKGSAFDVLASLTRRGLGGAIGDGKQYISWIHEEDFVRSIEWIIEKGLDGPINIAAPNPLPNGEFMRELRAACGVKLGLRASRWMLEIGTWLMQTESELMLKSRRVVPRRLLESGFQFHFPNWIDAARDLVQRQT